MDEIKHISVEEFLKLERNSLTLLDLREPDQVLLGAVEGAVNIPFSRVGKELEKLPKNKPVYVFCQEGSLSTEITEQLQDWGYEGRGARLRDDGPHRRTHHPRGQGRQPRSLGPDPEADRHHRVGINPAIAAPQKALIVLAFWGALFCVWLLDLLNIGWHGSRRCCRR